MLDNDETRRAAENVTGQLKQRGVDVRDEDSDSDLAMLLTAAQHFAKAVAARGGDSFTNTPESTEPDDPTFVMPRRNASETGTEYGRRIEQAALGLRARGD